jgi:aryl-alcohol dehydrogenase-like predicted oxidoreductase
MVERVFSTIRAHRLPSGPGQWVHPLTERGTAEVVVVIEKGGNPPNGTPEGISQELSEGLVGLGMDSVDIWLMHRDSPEVPVGEILAVLNEHQQARRMTICELWTSN